MKTVNSKHVSSATIKADRMSRDDQNMLAELARGRQARYNRAEMVTARRLARKGLVTITREVFPDGSALTWVQAR